MAAGYLIIKYSTGNRRALCDRLVCPSVCLSVCLSVFTITQEWVDGEWWNFAHLYLRSRVASKSKMGHPVDLWPGQTGVYIMQMLRALTKLHSVHVHRTHSCGILLYVYVLQQFIHCNKNIPIAVRTERKGCYSWSSQIIGLMLQNLQIL